MELTDLKESFVGDILDARVSEITLEDDWMNSISVADTGKNGKVGYLKIYQGDESWDNHQDPYYIEKNKEAIDSFVSLLRDSLYRLL